MDLLGGVGPLAVEFDGPEFHLSPVFADLVTPTCNSIWVWSYRETDRRIVAFGHRGHRGQQLRT
ncbi:hypothetical protein [Herbidospora daliensis]|uniref:hypothetical protein n=1 Tax=Herbidospora daliensis TaxID=295585 RepID=UPI0012F9319D|nr:hypothetical protein [Herbidospora daliensis]